MVAASILPVTIHKNKLCFLFGKENELEVSAPGWSDFGGGLKKNENPFKGALREGAEELTGFFGNADQLKKLIEENGGFLKMSFGTYHVHLFYLPYDENLIHYYNNNHKFIWDRMNHKELSKTMIFEKMEIKWFSIDELKDKKNDFRYFYRTFIDDLLENQKTIRDFITLKKSKKNKTMKNK